MYHKVPRYSCHSISKSHILSSADATKYKGRNSSIALLDVHVHVHVHVPPSDRTGPYTDSDTHLRSVVVAEEKEDHHNKSTKLSNLQRSAYIFSNKRMHVTISRKARKLYFCRSIDPLESTSAVAWS